jgi:hypothetical protein
MASPRPRPTDKAKTREALQKLQKKEAPKRGTTDESRQEIRKAAQEKIEAAREAARKDKTGPKRVPREEMIGNRKKPESAKKPVGRPVIKPEKKPADPNRTPKTSEYIITERAENFYPNGAQTAIPYDGIKPILLPGYGPEKQGPVPPMQKQGPVPPMQKQGPVSPMQMMQGMGQASPSLAQPGPAQRANAQQLQARAQQLQARLNAARGQGGQPRFR